MSSPAAQLFFVSVLDAVNSAINQVLDMDADNKRAIAELDSKVLRIEFTDIESSFTAEFVDEGIHLSHDSDAEADIVIRSTVVTFTAALLRDGRDLSQLQMMEITGDIKLAQQLFITFKSLEIDFEEELSRHVGDVPARSVFFAFRRLKSMVTGEHPDVSTAINHALTERYAVAPPRPRVERFKDQVDELSADTARLEQHVERLSRKVNS